MARTVILIYHAHTRTPHIFIPYRQVCAYYLTHHDWYSPLFIRSQLSWINFFMTFFATFAPAALLPLIRENLSLTKTQAGLAGEKTRPG